MVIKIGTLLLEEKNADQFVKCLAKQILTLIKDDFEVLIVSSGAIATGMEQLGIKTRPKEISKLQALAAVGQPHLMVNKYGKIFEKAGIKVAQILLIYDDLDSRRKRTYTRNTIEQLLNWNVLPIINENDTTAIDEIKIGDNDKLSAEVAVLVEAHLLILLTDVDGLYGRDGKVIPLIKEITPEIEALAAESKSELSTGGMITKINAAKIATEAGVMVVIANGKKPEILLKIVEGEKIGTWFVSSAKKEVKGCL